MPDTKESRRHSKRIAPGIAATSNRLETSKAILNVLKNVGFAEDLAFLKVVAGLAITILSTVQGIEEGEIDDDFVSLALDACGLVYIVIDICEEESERNGDTFDQMKVHSGELAKNLQEISEFVEKKAHRNLVKRKWKQSADEQKIVDYRDLLRNWMGKFGRSTDSSIHNALQEIIDEKLRKHEPKDPKAKIIITSQSFLEARPTFENTTLNKIAPPPPPKTLPIIPKVRDDNRPNLPPTIQFSGPAVDNPPSRTTTPDLHPLHLTVDEALQEKVEKERQRIEGEARKQKRLEDEQARKRAEKERWRKSEQDFIRLPEVSPNGEEKGRPSSSKNEASSSIPKPLVVVEIESDSEPETLLLPGPASAETKRLPRLEDELLAAALHAETQRELEAEDEEAAFLEAAKLQRQWEAEERRNERKARPKQKKVKRSPRNSAIHESPSPGIRDAGLHPEVLEGLRLAERHGGSENSPRSHSQSLEPDQAPEPSSRNRSVSPHGNDMPYNPYPLLPNPHGPYYPPPLIPHPSMSLHNFSHSGMSMGGPVHVSNHNSGNVHTSNITNSMNDYSVNYAADDSD